MILTCIFNFHIYILMTYVSTTSTQLKEKLFDYKEINTKGDRQRGWLRAKRSNHAACCLAQLKRITS
jgi:hypothetical protein